MFLRLKINEIFVGNTAHVQRITFLMSHSGISAYIVGVTINTNTLYGTIQFLSITADAIHTYHRYLLG
jgi:hypothetical protein